MSLAPLICPPHRLVSPALLCIAFSTMALADGPGLYGRVDPPVIWNNGTTPFTFEVVTTNANIASVTFIGVQEYAGLPMYDDGTHGDRVAGDGIFTLNNITCPPLPLRFGGAFLESPANAKVVATDGSSNFVQVSLGVVDIAQSIAAVKLADNIYATKYALFVVDPSFGPLSATTSEENSRGAGPFLKRATSALYSVLPDDFDLVAAMPGRDIYHSGDYGRPAGFFIGAAGQETVTGSRGRLKGILYHMFGEGLLLTHEFGHNWNAFAGRALGLTGCSQCSSPVRNPAGDIGGAVVLCAVLSILARALNGAGQLVDNGDGSWKLWRDPEHINGANAVYSKLDLYFMGLLPAAEVPPIHQLVNPDFTDINHVTATTVNTYSVSDITGGQAPPPSFPANFSTAFVIVNDREIAPAEFAFYSAVVRYYTGTSGPPSDVIPFYVATGGRATMNAVLPVSSAGDSFVGHREDPHRQVHAGAGWRDVRGDGHQWRPGGTDKRDRNGDRNHAGWLDAGFYIRHGLELRGQFVYSQRHAQSWPQLSDGRCHGQRRRKRGFASDQPGECVRRRFGQRQRQRSDRHPRTARRPGSDLSVRRRHRRHGRANFGLERDSRRQGI